MEERRKAERRITGRLQLRAALVGGRLVNQGPGGFAIETHRGLRVGEYYDFTVRNEASSFRQPTCRFAGRVRWCVLTVTIRQPNGEVQPVFQAGFERDSKAKDALKGTGFIDFPPSFDVV